MKLTIKVCGGKGGDGCVSFRHQRRKPLGGPDGGDGGDGGSVILVADQGIDSLDHISARRIYRAEDGAPGRSNGKRGKRGEDLIVNVPIDTEVYTGRELIGRISHHGDELIVARGGRSGRGNQSLRSSTARLPMSAEPGKVGEQREISLHFEIKIGVLIIGMTNSGKSLFLKILTGAHPRVSPRPFTSRTLNLGVLKDEYHSIRIGELPSGDLARFIRYLKNSKVIILLIDATGSVVEQYQDIIKFLREADMNGKERIVVFNKIDMLQGPYPAIEGEDCFYVSAINGSGIAEVRERILGLKDAS